LGFAPQLKRDPLGRSLAKLLAFGRRPVPQPNTLAMDLGIDFVKAAIAFVLVAGTGTGVFWLWLRERRRTLPGPDEALEALREENARYQAEVETRLNEFEERIDFVERRLVQEKGRARLPEARPKTPV
jgi:hypothetical protein